MSLATRIIRRVSMDEYISNPLIRFKKYLTMTDREKADDLAHRCIYHYQEWAEDQGIDVPEEIEDADELDPNQKLAFGDWCLQHIDQLYRPGSGDGPSWMYMDFMNIVQNDWLVHLTNDAWAIAHDGFQFGLEDYAEIAYTKWGKPQKIYDPDYAYSFAYTLGDLRRFGRDGRGGYKYGKQAVVFRSSGVRVTHWGDEEPQVIFIAGSARDIVPIIAGNNKEYCVLGSFGDRPLVEFDTIEGCAYWVAKNYDQYRKALTR